jgi:hypothetical protein
MKSYRVKVPREVRLAGHTASGQRPTVLPGEHQVHRLSRAATRKDWEMLRFVGADALGRDVHVPISRGRDIREVLPVEVICRQE